MPQAKSICICDTVNQTVREPYSFYLFSAVLGRETLSQPSSTVCTDRDSHIDASLAGKMSYNDPFQHLIPGYPKLAAKIEVLPEVAIYRKFGALNAQNLLYLQAELTSLERDLRDQQIADHNERSLDPNVKKYKYARSWEWLRESADDGSTAQLDLVIKIRETLKEYSKRAPDTLKLFKSLAAKPPQMKLLSSKQPSSTWKSQANGIFIICKTTCKLQKWDLSRWKATTPPFGAQWTIENPTNRTS